MRTGRCRALVVAALVLAAGRSGAGATGRLEATLGFGGRVAPGTWAPLWLSCAGAPEGASIQVLRKAADGSLMGTESFPAAEGQRIECPVSTDPALATLAVRLISGGSILAESVLVARARTFPGNIVLTCGLSARDRLGISAALMPAEPLLAADIDASELPANGLDYDGVSAVAIRDQGPMLAPAQRDALLAWIAGGGSLAITAARPGTEGLGASLGLAGGAAGSASPYGLGRIVLIAGSGDSWRRTLALEPYGSSRRLRPYAFAQAAAARSAEGGDAVARKAKAAVVAAIGAWLAAVLAALAFGRGRAAPLAAATALSLAVVVAGGRTLEVSFIRGASVTACALILPESGSSFVWASVRAEPLQAQLSWTGSRALEPLRATYADHEQGSIALGERGGVLWKHLLPLAAFSLGAGESGSLAIAAVLGRQSISGSTLPLPAQTAWPRGDSSPPELDSPGPLAFIAPGEDAPWWEKKPGSGWVRTATPPPWMEEQAQWIQSLREGAPRAFLAGRGSAPFLRLRFAGGAVRELRWALPLAEALPPEGGLQPVGGRD